MFDVASCVIQDPIRGLMIGQGEQIVNLYVMEGAVNMDSASMMATPFVIVVIDTSLWHNRLGHPSVEKIEQITNVLEIKQKNKSSFHCSVCPLAKQKHLPYVSHNNLCVNAFELLHIDIWGPFSVPTPKSYKYFLTIVDDHTRVTWIYLLKVSQTFYIFSQTS